MVIQVAVRTSEARRVPLMGTFYHWEAARFAVAAVAETVPAGRFNLPDAPVNLILYTRYNSRAWVSSKICSSRQCPCYQRLGDGRLVRLDPILMVCAVAPAGTRIQRSPPTMASMMVHAGPPWPVMLLMTIAPGASRSSGSAAFAYAGYGAGRVFHQHPFAGAGS